MPLSFKPFDSNKHLVAQRDLFRASIPENIGTPVESEEHYTWKFRAFPAEPASYEYVAYEDDKMVGYYAALPYPYVCDGKQYTAGMVCDVMTHPDMRGKGVFANLGGYATDALKKEGLAFTTGYPIRPEVIPGHLKVGWKIMFLLPMYMRFLKSNGALKSKGLGFLSPIGNIFLGIYNLIFRGSPLDSFRYQVFSRDEFLQRKDYDDFLQRWVASRKFALQKSREFLQWRTGAPQTDYRFVCAFESEKIIGVALVREAILQNIRCLAVLDLMTLPGKESAVGGICLELDLLAKSTGNEAVVTMMSPTWAKKYRVGRYGFLKTPFVFSLIIKKLDDAVDEQRLSDESNWHLMWIDSDDL